MSTSDTLPCCAAATAAATSAEPGFDQLPTCLPGHGRISPQPVTVLQILKDQRDMTDPLRSSLRKSAPGTRVHGAPRSPSTCRSQPTIWFQLANVRVTTLLKKVGTFSSAHLRLTHQLTHFGSKRGFCRNSKMREASGCLASHESASRGIRHSRPELVRSQFARRLTSILAQNE
jgi:hypothetical protein